MRSRITDEFWNFIEKYIPDYEHRNDVARQAELQLFIDGKESHLANEMDIDEAEDELNLILYNLYFTAIESYTNGYSVECDDCRLYKHFAYCPVCGKKQEPNG